MIVPMYKYSFLVFHDDYSGFLNDLKEVGVVHVIEKQQELSEETKTDLQNISKLKEAVKFLSKREVEYAKPAKDRDGLELLEDINEKRSEIDKLQQEKNALLKDRRQVEPWGEFSQELVNTLSENNINLYLYIVSKKQFKEEWKKNYTLEMINEITSDVYFAIFSESNEAPDIEADLVSIPQRTVKDIDEEISEKENAIEQLNKSLDDYAAKYIDLLNNTIKSLQENADFNKAFNSGQKEADEKVVLLEGWVPETKEPALKDLLDKSSVLFVKQTMQEEGSKKVPVLLKNNWFARLFESIGKLYSLPNAKEIDMTPFFAPFFALFFGFCLGDAGYGLLFIVAATIIKPKMNKEMKPIMSLLQILGLATVIFGAITGTFFGVMLGSTNIQIISKYKDTFLTNQEMFNLAIAIGVVQILFGMCIKTANKIKQEGFVYAVSTVGWIIMLMSSGLYFGANQIDPDFPVQQYSVLYYVLAGSSAIMILFFANPQKNVFINFGTGLWDVYSMITGLLGDLLSYIRLFALGISSAILGNVFNKIALQLSPDTIIVGQLVFIIIALFGHSINIFMASLGAFVHPMRLTFVEFYKNAGFTGGGHEYKPLSKIK